MLIGRFERDGHAADRLGGGRDTEQANADDLITGRIAQRGAVSTDANVLGRRDRDRGGRGNADAAGVAGVGGVELNFFLRPLDRVAPDHTGGNTVLFVHQRLIKFHRGLVVGDHDTVRIDRRRRLEGDLPVGTVFDQNVAACQLQFVRKTGYRRVDPDGDISVLSVQIIIRQRVDVPDRYR